jgi:NitT/TauT family transport system ATP-binding protein
VTHTYGRGDKKVRALDATDLKVEKGDFIALVGPSGCGKSTILKLVTGLMPASSGAVLVAGREVGAEPVRVGMAFQNPTLLPWLTLRDNVMLPLKIVQPFRREYHAKRKTEFRDRIDALLAQVGLNGFADKYRSAARWCTSRNCSCSMSRSARSISSPARSCGRSCRISG